MGIRWVKIFLAMALLGVLAPALAEPGGKLSSPEKMKQFIERRTQEVGAPGAAWVAIEEAGVSYSGATGRQDLGSPAKLSSETPMEVGSISKPITAAAVMQLVDSGAVRLDTPITRYLPEFELGAQGAADRITVRHLLSHTSGIGTLAGNLTQADIDTSPSALRARVATLSKVEPVALPGTRWEYSNANYQILGLLIEDVSGLSYERYIERNIFEPLGMADSYVFDPPETKEPAEGHRFWFGYLRTTPDRYKGRGSGPQGGAVLSAHDLGLFLAAMMNGKDDILSRATKEEMMQPQPGAPNYGLGWFLREDDKGSRVWHGGSSPGFQAVAAMRPDDKTGFAILTNAHSGFAFGDIRPLVWGAVSEAYATPPIAAGDRPVRLAVTVVLFVVPLFVIAYLFVLLRKRRRREIRRPNGGWEILIRAAVPSVLFLVMSYVLLVAVPNYFDAPLSAVWLYNPDIAILLVASASALFVLAVVRLWAVTTAEKHETRE